MSARWPVRYSAHRARFTIHLKAHISGGAEDGRYEGGQVSHTGQIAFQDEITEQVAGIEPSSSRTTTFTRLEEDGVFADHRDEDGFFLNLTQVSPDALADGLAGTITLGVDPAAVNDGSGGGGGQGPGGPGGPPPQG